MLEALKEIRARIRYLIDRAFSREFVGPLILFAALFVVATSFGMTSIFLGLLSDENAAVAGIPGEGDRGLSDALWWTLGFVIPVEKFAEMYGASVPIVIYALIMSIMGLAVFGVLVSIINNAMRSRIELLQQGDTPVKERGHVLILGWNNRVFSVLRQLARLRRKARVVILDDQDLKTMSEALRLAGINKLPLTIILRSGVPSNQEELKRVAVDRAAAIIALSDESDDSGAIKTLVLLANLTEWPGAKPTMTAEVAMEENYELAEIGARGRLHVVSASRVSSRIIVQTVRNHGLAQIYRELMSLEGNSISVQSMPQCTGKTLREVAYGFSGSIPIGVSWQENGSGSVRHKAGLNPEPDYDLAEDEQLVLLSRNAPIAYRTPPRAYQSTAYRPRDVRPSTPERILLIGWSDVLLDVLRELDAHVPAGSAVVIASTLEPEDIEERLPEAVRARLVNLGLSFSRADATRGAAFEPADLLDFDSVVVLSHRGPDAEEPDSRALRILLRLSEQTTFSDFKSKLIVEITDQANRELFTSLGVRDVVVSSDVISAQLAQISQQPVLGSIYRELLSAGGVEISLRPADQYVVAGSECRFDDLVFAAQQNAEIALGLYLDEQDVLLNPSRDATWTLGANDQVIVLAQELYR